MIGISVRPIGLLTAAVSCFFLLAPVCFSAPPNLVASYGFNEGSGSSVADASGNGNGGTLSATTWSTAGKFGNALSFNGTSSYVLIPDAALLDLTNGLTLEAWVNPVTASGWRMVIMKESPTALAYALYARDTGNRPSAYINTGGSDQAAVGTAAVALNVWTHLAMTYDGSRLRFFVNGVEKANSAVSGNIITTSSNLRIGGNSIWGEYFKGLIDEVRVYNRALSAAEIQSDMNTPIASGPTISLTAPLSGASVSGAVAVTAAAAAPAGVAGVQFKLDGNNLGAEDTTAPYSLTWDSTTVVDGTHVLSATLRDTSGVTTASAQVSVTVANTVLPPTISLASPAAGANISGTVAVSATASASSGVAGVQFKLDGANLGVEDTTSPYSVNWNTTAVTNGAHVLSATVRASNGATANSQQVSVNVNNTTTPTVSLTAPAAGANLSGTVTVSATASDSAGIAGVQFLLDGSNLGAEVLTSPYSVSWNTTTAVNGGHTLSARARNTNSGTATSAAVSVSVNNGQDPTLFGQWSGVQTWPIVPVNTILLYTGKVLTFDRTSAGPTAQVWDPVTNTFTNVPNNFTDLFCSGHSILADGRVLIIGGHGPVNAGTADVNIFDPASQTWTLAPRMAYERWYPTSVLLPNGKVFAFTGTAVSTTDYVSTPELYDPAANSWTKLTGASVNMYMYGQGHVLPNGKIGYAGNWEFDDNARVLDLTTQTWTTVDATSTPGYSVMYEPGKVLKVGSSGDSGTAGDSSATAYILDFTAPSPAWQSVAPMQYARTHHNLTMLPDGTMLVTGGSTKKEGYIVGNAVLTPELWSPVTKTFKPMAPHVKPRLYHSEALLLPDGRVLVSGGGRDGAGVDQYNVEIFSPPYLFKGTRPTISSIPATATYGGTFFVATPDAASISTVSMIRPGSVTHGQNMDQRFLNLSFQQVAGGVNVTAPANANLAPPGHYMVFLVNGSGVPSTASFIRFPLPSAGAPPTAPGALSGTGGFGTSSLTWTASTSSSGISNYNVHRSTTSGFTPAAANRVGQPGTTSYFDSGLAGGRYYYVVTAEDVNHQLSAASNEAFVDVLSDTQAPTVTLTAPTTTTISGSVTVSADAIDNVQVAGVQFLLDGVNLGTEVAAPPYAMVWNSAGTSNGAHTLAARARDNGGNAATTPPLNITVSNAQPSGLVASYSFSEGSGTTTVDRSGNGNNGSISGATWSTAGTTGNALSFNGTNARVTIPDSNSLHLTNGMTLEAWVRPTAITAWRTIILKEDTSDLAYSLYANGDANRPGSWIRFATGTQSSVGTAQLALNTWTHVAATYNGSALRIFVNGVQVNSLSVSGNMVVTTRPLQIGGNQVWGEYFQGLIDDVRVYNRALTPAEIQSDMNRAVAP